MGAWGTGIFEDDMSLDLLSDIEKASDLRQDLDRRLRDIVNRAALGYEDAFDALVSAAIVDACVNRTPVEELHDLLAHHPSIDLHPLRTLAAAAVGRVLDPAVELHRLWADSPRHYPAWHANLTALKNRLAES